MKEKVLVIKIGLTEFLQTKTDDFVSLGDVVRSTPILHCFNGAHVTWLTDKSCYPFLDGIPQISRLMHYDLTTVLQLQSEYFDSVVNLEKAPGICALADSIRAWKRYGFRFNPLSGEVAAYSKAEKVLEVSANQNLKQKDRKTFSEFLFEVVGEAWKGQGYLLGYKSRAKVLYDVGFNIHVGQKWPTKAWPEEYWKELEQLLIKSKYSVSYQQGLTSLYEYMDWIHSCRCIVTNDSLGLHLANAMKKKIVAFFGPTYASEIALTEKGALLTPQVKYGCMPCFLQKCTQKKRCVYFIQPKEVKAAVDKIMGR